MSNQRLETGHYYKVISDDVIKVFKVKEWFSKEELELSSDCVTVYESIEIIRDSINSNRTTLVLVMDSNYTIEEIDEKDFYSIVKLFTLAKEAILSIVKRNIIQ